ncbi:SDR family NAD(P)-dependent oxidoreductase [Mycolicibacterium thermoresistibile]
MGDSAANDFPLPHASTDLTGQVALVTGASAGLGRRFALTLAAAGARVVATARRADRLKELAEEIAALGGQCEPFALDVTDADACEAAIDHAEKTFGTVTILVNNAGINDAQRAHKMPLELIDAVIATNVRAPYVLSTSVARRLIEAKLPGRIVNLSSMVSYNYTGNAAALYSTTKAAVNRMTETLAVEWVRYGINVNAICPGSFASEMHDGLIERVGDFTHRLPRKRVGQPAQLDSTLLYLVGPSSELVTGTVIKVDDGQFPR